jgi:hypothetical protein
LTNLPDVVILGRHVEALASDHEVPDWIEQLKLAVIIDGAGADAALDCFEAATLGSAAAR